MNDNYILMHKDKECGLISVDRDSGSIRQVRIYDDQYSPFLGRKDQSLIRQWWDHRAVPAGREDMKKIVLRSGCVNNKGYLARNLGLSLTDTYWICPVEAELSWDQVKLYRMADQNDNEPDIIPYSGRASYDPNASLSGQMDKYWDMTQDVPMLCKKAYRAFGQQAVNEVFASELHQRQNAGIGFVDYSIRDLGDGGKEARCAAFTSETVEFVSAFEVIRSRKAQNNVSPYDSFIDICADRGIDADIVRRYLDYQTLTDFIITNTDRHLLNFGVLRNADTLELIAPAPIFDSGNSMFFAEPGGTPLTAAQIIRSRITAIRNTEAEMLKLVKHRDIVDIHVLPSPDEVRTFYISHGIPEERSGFIADCYMEKLGLFESFTRGERLPNFR